MKKIVSAAILMGLAGQVFAADWAPSNIQDTFLNRATVQAVKAPAARLASCAEDSCGSGRIVGAPTYEEAKAYFDAAQMPSPEKLAGTQWGAIAILKPNGSQRFDNGKYLTEETFADGEIISDAEAFSWHTNPLTGKMYLETYKIECGAGVKFPYYCARLRESMVDAVVVRADKTTSILRYHPYASKDIVSCKTNKGLLVCFNNSYPAYFIYKQIPESWGNP